MSILCNVSEETLNLMTDLITAGQAVMATKGADQDVEFSESRVVSSARIAQTAIGRVKVLCKHGTVTLYLGDGDTYLKYTCTVESDVPHKEQMNQALDEMLELTKSARTADRDEALLKVQRMEEVLDAATAWLTTKVPNDRSQIALVTVDAAFPKRPGQCYVAFAFRQVSANLIQWAGAEMPELTEIIESRVGLEHRMCIQPANRFKRTPMSPQDILRSVKHLPEHLRV